MKQVVLPLSLLSACSLAEFSQALLEHYVASCEGVRSAWVTLKEESSAPPRMVACLQRDNAGVHIKTESALPLLLPIEISRLPQLPESEAQTFQLPNSEYPLTLFPFVARLHCFGHLIVRWSGATAEQTVSALFETVSALSPLLYGHHRENLFLDLERGKQQWEATFDSMRDLLFIYDTSGKLLRVNKALAERLDSSPREVMLKPQKFHKVFGEAAEACQYASIWRSQSLDSAFEVTCGQVSDRQRSLIGNVYILRDITDKERLETQMRQNEKLAELGEMVSCIAHELNQRLTSIVGFAELLEKSALHIPEEMQSRVHKIVSEADRAEAFVKNLLSFVRPIAPKRQPLSLNEVAGRVVDLRGEQAKKRHIALKLRLAENLPLIESCDSEMEQVLLNMIDNAIHAINSHKQAGSIVITTRYEGGETVTMAVTDDGPGILPELRDKIHLPFFTTKKVGEGSGLGLAISQSILRSYGATLKIHSEAGLGAAFVMEFPLCKQSLRVEDPSNDLMKTKTSRPNRSGLRLAVLDDDEAVLGLLEDMLGELGHIPVLFHAPSQMLAALETETFGLILSDVWMPDMTGIELQIELRKRFTDYASRVIFLTGDALPLETRSSLQKAGCRFVEKPFRLDDLERSIHAILRSSKSRERAA